MSNGLTWLAGYCELQTSSAICMRPEAPRCWAFFYSLPANVGAGRVELSLLETRIFMAVDMHILVVR